MSRRSSARAYLIFALSLAACAPTLSKPRGKTHLDALAAGEAEQHHGRYSEAAAAYGRAADNAERRVDRDEALYRQSRVLARAGDYPQAIAICDRLGASETIARRTLRARFDAARYRLLVGEEERAERDLRALAIAHPNEAAARSALRVLLQRHVEAAEDKQLALAWARELEREVGRSWLGEVLLSAEAELLVELDHRNEAMTVLERQVDEHPYPKGLRWEESLWRLADLALEQGDPRRAIAYLKRMVAVQEESFFIASYTRPKFSKAALRIARIYRDELHDDEAAIDAYADLRSDFPHSLFRDDALAEEAELRFARGERERGCSLLREVLESHDVGSARRRAEARLKQDCP